jgi:glycerol-3-phosphate acyltransferase PlsY
MRQVQGRRDKAAPKGLVAVLIGRLLGVHAIGLGLIAFAAVIGHVFPVFFGFKGGKGVATMIGALLGLSLWLGLATIAVWIVVALLSRYASLASLVAAVAAILFALLLGFHGYCIPLMFIAILVVWKHIENIERLRKGEESKINLKKAKS